MKSPRIALIAICIAVSGLSLTAEATILKFFSLEAQVKQSTIIVQGTVMSSKTEIRNKIPYTLSDIHITETLKGTVAKNMNVTVRQRGGSVGTYAVHADGDPVLKPGTNCLLFLIASKGEYVLSGMAQGIYTIEQKGSLATISNMVTTPRLNTTTGEIASGPILAPQSADAYLARVREVVTAQNTTEQ